MRTRDHWYSRISMSRSLTDYYKVRRLIAHIVRNQSRLVKWKQLREREYLDVGCGANVHENFINLDYWWYPGVDVCWDITKGIPLPNAAVRGIFTEHCLEHLPLCAVDRVLGEFRRVLEPGGCVRIVVPDGELYLTRYADITRKESKVRLPNSETDTYDGLYSPMMSVNRIFREHGHMFIYDFDVLRQLLEKNGFIDIKEEKYKSGRDPLLLIDTERRAIESLYMEASVAAAGSPM